MMFFSPLETSLPKEIDGAALLYVAILFVRNKKNVIIKLMLKR